MDQSRPDQTGLFRARLAELRDFPFRVSGLGFRGLGFRGLSKPPRLDEIVLKRLKLLLCENP